MSHKALWQGVLCIGVGIVGAALAAAPGWGAPRDRVNLFLSLNARGSAEVALQLDFPPPRALPLARSVSQALGGTLQRARWETDGAASTLPSPRSSSGGPISSTASRTRDIAPKSQSILFTAPLKGCRGLSLRR